MPTPIVDLLRLMDAQDASDLFLSVGKPPALRIYGKINEVDSDSLTTNDFTAFFANSPTC